MVLCLMVLGGCAGKELLSPQVLPKCQVPLTGLVETLVPPRSDATNQELLMEAEALRAGLLQCNADKQDTLNAIKELQK